MTPMTTRQMLCINTTAPATTHTKDLESRVNVNVYFCGDERAYDGASTDKADPIKAIKT